MRLLSIRARFSPASAFCSALKLSGLGVGNWRDNSLAIDSAPCRRGAKMRIGPKSSASALATSRGQYPRISDGRW